MRVLGHPQGLLAALLERAGKLDGSDRIVREENRYSEVHGRLPELVCCHVARMVAQLATNIEAARLLPFGQEPAVSYVRTKPS